MYTANKGPMSYLDDPRVLFAAERTLLAWSRTSVAIMGFGFVVERFELFLRAMAGQPLNLEHRGLSFWIGIGLLSSLPAKSGAARPATHTGKSRRGLVLRHRHSLTRLSRNAVWATDIELSAIAVPAKIGDSSSPNAG